MAKVTYGPAIKAVALLILLVVFFYLFFWQVVVQYSEKFTNTVKIVEQAETVEMPTFTICSGWKHSLLHEYNISPMIFNMPADSDSNLPANATMRSLFDDLNFKLNKDFVIALGPVWLKPILLNVGRNEMKTENSIYQFEVKEMATLMSGMCYVIIPMGIYLKPYEELMQIIVARNNTGDNEEMKKVSIQISSNDTYNTIIHKISGVKNSISEKDFTSNTTINAIYYTEENTELIKDCSDSSFFKRLAEKFERTEKFNCTKKCIPLVYDSMMDNIDHSVPKCTAPIETDEYCMIGMKGYEAAQRLKSTCIKQCKYKGSTLDVMEIKQKSMLPLGKDMNAISYPYTENSPTY